MLCSDGARARIEHPGSRNHSHVCAGNGRVRDPFSFHHRHKVVRCLIRCPVFLAEVTTHSAWYPCGACTPEIGSMYNLPHERKHYFVYFPPCDAIFISHVVIQSLAMFCSFFLPFISRFGRIDAPAFLISNPSSIVNRVDRTLCGARRPGSLGIVQGISGEMHAFYCPTSAW